MPYVQVGNALLHTTIHLMVRQCGAPSAQNTTIYCAEFALIQLGREARTEALIIHVWPTFDPAALRLHVASFPLSFVL